MKSDPWMRNALATGAITPPNDSKLSSTRPAWITVALGAVLIIVSIVFW